MIVRDALQERGRYLQQLQATTRAAALTVDVEIRRLQAIVETLSEAPKLRSANATFLASIVSPRRQFRPTGHANCPLRAVGACRLCHQPAVRGDPSPATAIPETVAARRGNQADGGLRPVYLAGHQVPLARHRGPGDRERRRCVCAGRGLPAGLRLADFRREPFPAGVLGVMIDRNNIILARKQSETEFLGSRSASQSSWKQ